MAGSLWQQFSLSKTCPNCTQSFWKFNKVRGLLFCPHCQQNLVVKSQDSAQTDKISPAKILQNPYRFMLSLTVVIAVFMQLKINWLSHIDPKFVTPMLILTGLVGIYWMVRTIYRRGLANILMGGTLSLGVDEIDKVRGDKGYYGLLLDDLANTSDKNLVCPNCGPRRLSDWYWYKTNLAKQNLSDHLPLSNPQTEDFLGCLNCHTGFNYKIYRPAITIKQVLKMAFLTGLFLVWMGIIFGQHMDAFAAIERLDSSYAMAIKATVIGLWTYFFVLMPLAKRSEKLPNRRYLEPVYQKINHDSKKHLNP